MPNNDNDARCSNNPHNRGFHQDDDDEQDPQVHKREAPLTVPDERFKRIKQESETSGLNAKQLKKKALTNLLMDETDAKMIAHWEQQLKHLQNS